MDIHQILVKYWGYTRFRPMQEEIIRSVLDGNDTLALMPTGGGKSLCYQIPAIAQEGTCLVISPLIALMRDQVDRLRKMDIKAFAIYSGMNSHEIEVALNNVIMGEAKFLYISPERLASHRFRDSLRHMKINLLAVDEAHCISQWGYDFRPPYLQIAEIRPMLPSVPVLAVTASATPDVVDDIQEKLQFRKKNLLRQSFVRKNLAYMVFKEENKNGKLVEFLKSVQGSAIVYAGTRRKVYEIARHLVRNGISADYYHAGMENKEREARQKAWMAGKLRVIVATNAFGMGIDKSDVRMVIHMDVPDCLEEYFQEAGRAGRDGKKAWSVVFYHEADIQDAVQKFEQSYPPLETIRRVYHALGNYYQLAPGSGKNLSFDFDIADFSRQFNLNAVIAYNSLKILEKEGYILLSEGIHFPPRIHVKLQGEKLYRYRVEHPESDLFLRIILRSYTGLFSQYVRFQISELARRAGLTEEQTIKNLIRLSTDGVITYIPPKDKPQLIFTEDRLNADDLYISDENYALRKKSARKRLAALTAYLQNNSVCRSQQLLEYFGETQIQRCGICDVCSRRNRLDLNEAELNAIINLIKPLLEKGPLPLEEIFHTHPPMLKEKIITVVEWLLEQGKVAYTSDKKLYWRTAED